MGTVTVRQLVVIQNHDLALFLILPLLYKAATFLRERFKAVSAKLAYPAMHWLARVGVLFAVLLSGGCGGELARQDRDVRASWAALQAADTMNAELAERLAAAWRRTVEANSLIANDSADLLAAISRGDVDLGDPAAAARYGRLRARVAAHIKSFAEMLSSPGSANLAWRLRGLRKECTAALLRSQGALAAYNSAARAYNRSLGAGAHYVAEALLFPGLRQFAVLEDTPDVSGMK